MNVDRVGKLVESAGSWLEYIRLAVGDECSLRLLLGDVAHARFAEAEHALEQLLYALRGLHDRDTGAATERYMSAYLVSRGWQLQHVDALRPCGTYWIEPHTSYPPTRFELGEAVTIQVRYDLGPEQKRL